VRNVVVTTPRSQNGVALPSIHESGALELENARALISGAGLAQRHPGYEEGARALVQAVRTREEIHPPYTTQRI
jgi:hypothetical protein